MSRAARWRLLRRGINRPHVRRSGRLATRFPARQEMLVIADRVIE